MLTIILSVLLAFFAVAAFLGWWEYVKANRQYHQARGAAQELARVLGDARRHLERRTPLVEASAELIQSAGPGWGWSRSNEMGARELGKIQAMRRSIDGILAEYQPVFGPEQVASAIPESKEEKP